MIGTRIFYLGTLRDYGTITHKFILNQKLTVLLLLLGARRLRAIRIYTIDIMTLNDMSLIFLLNKSLKDCKKCRLPEKFEYRVYNDKKLYLIVCLNDHISWQNCLEQLNRKQLIITITKPHRRAPFDTWVKLIFADNTKIGFSSHCHRVASASKVNTTSVNVDKIIRGGSWKTKRHFFMFCNKDIALDDIDLNRRRVLFFIRN